jgi:hypothetical protein
MPYTGPDTSRTEHACEKCNHFGGWVERDEGSAWCLHSQRVNALSYSGCCSWTPQPVGWLYPPELDPTPGLRSR